MNATTAREILRLPRRHPLELRAIVSVAGWAQTPRRRGDTGPIRYGRSHTAPGVAAEDAVRVILAEARRVVGSLSSGGSSAQRSPEAEGQVEQHQGEAGSVHSLTISPASSAVESQTGGAL